MQALILIDVQEGFNDPSWGNRNNPQAETNIRTLLEFFRMSGRPVIHVQHLSTEPNSPLRPEKSGSHFMAFATPMNGEPVFQKNVNSAFIGTSLESHLRAAGIDSLILVGFTTDHCVSTSTRMATNLGFKTTLIGDALVTFERQGVDGTVYPAELVHQVNLASLKDEFARVFETTAEFLAQS